MKGFSGFPAGKVHFTPLPNLFFSQLLPAIDDLAELKVTLHIFWLLHQKKGYPRYVSRRELEADGVLLGGLRGAGQESEERLGQALERAVARGTLLHVTALRRGSGQAQQEDERDDWYFMNTDAGRKTVDKIRHGELELEAAVSLSEVRLEVERPNIFVLYEQNIGLLTPLIAEELRDAEKAYPAGWIEEAFRIAVEHNARHWRYVRSVLERWATEGKDSGAKERKQRWYTKEEYEKFIKH
ncbi:MAG: DnaD domain protein [Anaerolineales bacterium]|nr:DnaD domain protein [Anaerolineales bacterium]